MKFNLKNRPVLSGYGESHDQQEECIRKVYEWFEGIEKELREKYDKAIITNELFEDIVNGQSYEIGKRDLVKEILGE